MKLQHMKTKDKKDKREITMNKKQKDAIQSNILKISEMNSRELEDFTMKLHTAKPDMDKTIFSYTLRATDIHREDINSKLSAEVVRSELPTFD